MSNQHIPDIIKLSPNRVWRTYQGGRLLDAMTSQPEPADTHFPENWIASTTRAVNHGREDMVEEGLSKVDIDGNTYILKDLITAHPELTVGLEHYRKYGADAGFLLKFLDPAIRLHIQCHPTIKFAQKYLSSNSGKTEGYIILGSREEVKDPHIYLGFDKVPTKDEMKAAIKAQDVDFMLSSLRKIPVKPGDAFLVPGGQPHAIGAGVFMVEIMEPTDFAVRVEFERGGYVLPESARFMNRDIDFALSMFEFNRLSNSEIEENFFVQPSELEHQDKSTLYSVIDNRYTKCFKVDRLVVDGCFRLSRNSFYIAVVVSGKGEISSGGMSLKAAPGDQFMIPFKSEEVEFHSEDGKMEILLASR